MYIPFVDLKAQYHTIKPEIDAAIENVITETAFIGGKYVKEFETAFASMYDVKHCISCANGTDSLYIIMKMLGIGNGDEVITVANSWISSSETISQTGAKPVFVDISETYNTINETLIQEAITPKTKAIMPVHLYGQACNLDVIMEIAKANNLFVIEDCAQSHFTKYNNKLVGTFGIASSFSFYPGKNIGAYGDAGCILTNDDDLAAKCKMYANHGALKKHQHQIEGINSRLDGLQAAILSVKIKYIHQWNAKRNQVANWYLENLKDIKELVLPVVRANSFHTFHLFVIRTNKRDALALYLKENNIETAIHYPTALPNLPAYKYLNYSPNQFPIATSFQSQILSLPIYPELSLQQVQFVAQHIKTFFTLNNN